MTEIPVAGIVGKANVKMPTLIPNFDKPVASGNGAVGMQSPAAFLAANPRADATGTITIGGTVTTGDEISLLISNAALGAEYFGSLSPNQVDVTYTTVGGDTVTTIAEALSVLINDNTILQQLGLRADTAGAVVTVHQNGPIGNLTTITAPTEAPAKVTVAGTALTGDVLAINFAGPAAAATAPATGTVTIGGTPAATDTIPLVFTNTGVASFPITKTYTVVANDTTTTIAVGLAALINADAALGSAGVSATVSNNVLTVSQNGAIGNGTTLSATPTHGGGGSETTTFSNSGVLQNGKGVPGSASLTATFNTTTGNSATTMAAGLVTAITNNLALAALGITATNSSGVITLVIPATIEPIVVTSWVNTITPTATITGSVAAADILNITITSAAIAGGSSTVSHTTLLGETTTTLATNLTATINATPALIAAGITATSSANVITFLYPAASGSIRFSQSVSPGSETITLSTTPTETIVVATNATETVTISNSGLLSGGTGPIICVNNFVFAYNGQVKDFWYGQPYQVGYDYLVALVNQKQPVI